VNILVSYNLLLPVVYLPVIIKIPKAPFLSFAESQERTTPSWIPDVYAGKSQEAVKDFFTTPHNLDPKLVVLSTLPGEKSEPFIPPEVSEGLPKLMSELHDESSENLPYEELLIRCQVVMQNMCCVSEEKVKQVEEKPDAKPLLPCGSSSDKAGSQPLT